MEIEFQKIATEWGAELNKFRVMYVNDRMIFSGESENIMGNEWYDVRLFSV